MSTLEIQNLVVYKVNQQRHSTTRYVPLVKNLSATFESGKINAIMGPNGSSKTTLLNILYGTCEPDTKTSGRILYNGSERSAGAWFSSISYSEQDCCAIEDQTVLEAIRFSLNMHEASNGKATNSEARLQELISNLQLEKVADSKINVVSGGERKRTMMAIDMVLGRKILVLDEPTSDLDSRLAYKVTKYLERLAAEQDLMIIMTVHQPSPMLFEVFGNFLFMHNGMQVYNGPVSGIVEYMGAEGIVQPESLTTAEFLFEAFGGTSSFKRVEDLRPQIDTYISKLNDAWEQNRTELHQTNEVQRCGSINIGHVWLLTKRQFLRDLRSRYSLSRICSVVFCQVLYMYLFLDGFKLSNPGEYLLAGTVLFGLETACKMFYLSTDGTSAFAAKAQLSKEISKNFYSSLSLCVSIVLTEILSNLVIASIVIGGMSILMGTNTITTRLVVMILCQAVFSAPTALLMRLLQNKVSEFNSIVGKIVGFLTTMWSSIGCLVALMYSALLFPRLAIVFRALGWLLGSFYPSHLMGMFIMGSFEDASVGSSKGWFQMVAGGTVGFLTNGMDLGHNWLLGGFIVSLTMISLIVPILFTSCFGAHTRLQMSKKGNGFGKKTGVGKSRSRGIYVLTDKIQAHPMWFLGGVITLIVLAGLAVPMLLGSGFKPPLFDNIQHAFNTLKEMLSMD